MMYSLDEKASDHEYQEHAIERVDRETKGYAVTMDDGWTIYVQDVGVEPQPGDTIRLYGQGWGRSVRGIDINGRTVRYQTAAQERAEQDAWAAEREAKDQREYIEKAADYQKRIGALPAPFQCRIAQFRAARPEHFNVDHLAYELFVCEEALKIAAHCQTGDAVREFHDAPLAEQQTIISDQHSGNTFGAACRLAYAYLDHPDLLWQEHGALCGLVGCQDYGCYAAYPDALTGRDRLATEEEA
jgi:hypothetical protein